MDAGQLVFVYSRLILGALAAFFAAMLWSKTRDAAWMLMVIGVIAAYIGTVHSVLEILGIDFYNTLFIGSVPLVTILLPALSTVFFIAAFLVMVIRRYRNY
jgi:uncharacterized membrane protein